VQNGIVTLEGQVDHDYQRREVERMVRNVRGVVNVVNLVTVRPPVTPRRVEEEIEQETLPSGSGCRHPLLLLLRNKTPRWTGGSATAITRTPAH
jgi:hypothetical protein